MTKIRLELNKAGVRALLNSPEVRSDLTARAHRIRNAAGPGFEVSQASGDRATVFIRTADRLGREREAKERALSRALTAGG